MKEKVSSLNFTLRIKAALLHKLLQSVAGRAYRAGHEDGRDGHAPDEARVNIDPSLLRKFL